MPEEIMSREYQFHQEKETVTTQYGEITLTAQDRNVIYCEANAREGRGITVNGVRYNATAHIYRHEDGVWRAYSPESSHQTNEVHARRPDDWRKEPSSAALKKIAEIFCTLATDFAIQNHASMIKGEITALNNELYHLEKKIAEHQKALDTLTAERDQLTRRQEAAIRGLKAFTGEDEIEAYLAEEAARQPKH
jgi:hypothetical protein